MPTTEDAPITTAEIADLLRKKIPPAGPDDPATVFTSTLIALSQRADAQDREIAKFRGMCKFMGEALAAHGIIASDGQGRIGIVAPPGVQQEGEGVPEQPAPGGQRTAPQGRAPQGGGDDGPPIPMQTKQHVSTGPIPGVTAPAAPPPPVVVTGAPQVPPPANGKA